MAVNITYDDQAVEEKVQLNSVDSWDADAEISRANLKPRHKSLNLV